MNKVFEINYTLETMLILAWFILYAIATFLNDTRFIGKCKLRNPNITLDKILMIRTKLIRRIVKILFGVTVVLTINFIFLIGIWIFNLIEG